MCFCFYLVFFFFKQKTAYEMRISDWSSDVCSSDLKTLSFNAQQRGSHLSGVDSTSCAHIADALITSNHGAKKTVVSTAPPGTGKPAFVIRISDAALPPNSARFGNAALENLTIMGLGMRSQPVRSEEHTSELQSQMRPPFAVFCLKTKNKKITKQTD